MIAAARPCRLDGAGYAPQRDGSGSHGRPKIVGAPSHSAVSAPSSFGRIRVADEVSGGGRVLAGFEHEPGHPVGLCDPVAPGEHAAAARVDLECQAIALPSAGQGG